MIRFGVIGYGYWGPNIVRNLYGINGAIVHSICDQNENCRKRATLAFPAVHVASDPIELLTSPEIDAVAVITPVWTHFDLAKAALLNGKHVFVEKPFTSTSEQAEELIELAEKRGLTIMVDHTFLFTGTVRKIRQLIDEDTLGKIYYYDSMRVNLGLFQHDVDVLWDLAPHDLSIMDYLIGKEAEAVVATGATHVNGHADVAFMTIYYPDNVIGHVNVNWLSPVKIRMTLIGGEKRMLVWNDVVADEKLRIYDKGVQINSKQGVYDLLVSYRSGDMWAPKIESTEALKAELQYFVGCVERKEKCFNDGMAGLRVVKMLEAAQESLKRKGEVVYA
jgi:predicted dehydrogenase